jgi:hypothetical protein
MPNPVLTVVFVAGNCRERVQRALRGLLSQDIADQIAIIVYDRADQPRRDLPELTSPNVTYEAVGKNSTLGQLQKRGLLAATTDVIAFIEEHVLVPPGWARESLRLHSEGYAGVTGFFLAGNPQHRWSRLTFSITYGDYALSRNVGVTTTIPGDNSSFIRNKVLHYADDLEKMLNSDILLIRRLVDDGEQCYRANLALKHWNEDKWWDAWTALRLWNQMYMSNRLTTEKWPLRKRVLRTLSLPLIPLHRLYSNFKYARTNRSDMKQFCLDLPAVAFLHIGSAAGIAAGLLFGYQNSEIRFADCETNASRPD